MPSRYTLRLRPAPGSRPAGTGNLRVVGETVLEISGSVSMFHKPSQPTCLCQWEKRGWTTRSVVVVKSGPGTYEIKTQLVGTPDFIWILENSNPVLFARFPGSKASPIDAISMIKSSKPKAKEPETQAVASQKSVLPEQRAVAFSNKLKSIEQNVKVEAMQPLQIAPPTPTLLESIGEMSHEEIASLLISNPKIQPFAGLMPGAKFARVALDKGLSIDHYIVGHIPLGSGGFLLIGIPAHENWSSPPTLPEFKHYLPGRSGGGYWVKYISTEIQPQTRVLK